MARDDDESGSYESVMLTPSEERVLMRCRVDPSCKPDGLVDMVPVDSGEGSGSLKSRTLSLGTVFDCCF
jgi:hypothetical protein